MSTWIKSPEVSWYHKALMTVLQYGPMPKHLAFIMDGNRRFARKRDKAVIHGHISGFDQLSEILGWCHKLGILEVTVYAFSIENFKRTQAEVDGLMKLSREKFQVLLKEKDKILEQGVRIRVLGKLSLLPRDIQEAIAEVMIMSRHNTKCTLNVCMSYTAREEMAQALEEVRCGVQQGRLEQSDVTPGLVTRCLYTEDSPPVDLLVRTSGEVRLSDFMLWQSSYACLRFEQVYWPEFTIWHLYKAIIQYQRNYYGIQRVRKESHESDPFLPNERVEKFLEDLYARRLKYLESLRPLHLEDLEEEEEVVVNI